MHDWVKLAQLTKAKTLQGGLVAQSVSGLPFLLTPGLCVHFVPPQIDAPRTAHVVSVSGQTDDAALVCFDTVPDLTTAELLLGCYCLVSRASLPEDALLQAGWGIEGYSVYDRSDGFIGVVDSIEEKPGQNLLVVCKPGDQAPQTALIPLVEEFFLCVDEQEQRIDVALPSGLLEL